MRLSPRPAKPASRLVNGLKSVGYTAALWAIFLFALPLLIRRPESTVAPAWLRFEPGTLRIAAVIVFSAASLVGFYCGYLLVRLGEGTPMPLACTRRMVISGPYRYLRNPMSAMGIAQGIAVGIYLGSPSVVFYALAGALVWDRVLRPWEERDLADRFGEEYRTYRSHVRCWIPRLTPYSSAKE